MNNYDESFHSPSPLPGTLLGASHTAKDLILPTTLWVQRMPCRGAAEAGRFGFIHRMG